METKQMMSVLYVLDIQSEVLGKFDLKNSIAGQHTQLKPRGNNVLWCIHFLWSAYVNRSFTATYNRS